MRSISISSFLSSLLVTVLLLPALILAARFEGPLEVLAGYGYHPMLDGKLPSTLHQVLLGHHNLRINGFPGLEIAPYVWNHPLMNEAEVEEELRRSGDKRHIIVLGGHIPGDPQWQGLTAAFRVTPDTECDHTFAFFTAEHVPHGQPKVWVNGFAEVFGAPNVEGHILTHARAPTSNVYGVGQVLTPKELFAYLPDSRIAPPHHQ